MMYLHAGNHKNIRLSDIIGVFDTDNVTISEAGKKFLSAAQKKAGDTPDKLEMQIGKPVYSSDRRPILEDLGKPEGKRSEMVVRVGEVFRMGSSATGISQYKLISFDEKKMVAVLHRASGVGKSDPAKDELGKVMLVTREGGIPEDSRVVEPITAPQENLELRKDDVQNLPRRGRR